MSAEKIVTVWYDETSDVNEPKWIVDIDTVDGGSSRTVDTFDTRAEAVEFGEKFAAEKGLNIEIRD